jgi:hypothetical protein
MADICKAAGGATNSKLQSSFEPDSGSGGCRGMRVANNEQSASIVSKVQVTPQFTTQFITQFACFTAAKVQITPQFTTQFAYFTAAKVQARAVGLCLLQTASRLRGL